MGYKKSRLYSILNNRCPRCHEGKFWKAGPVSSLTKHGGNCYDSCSHCGLKYEREPGFFYGAMYVSYALGIAMMVTAWVATSVLFPEMGPGLQATIIIVSILAWTPWNYWLSRIIWMNLFYHYEEEEERQIKSSHQ